MMAFHFPPDVMSTIKAGCLKYFGSAVLRAANWSCESAGHWFKGLIKVDDCAGCVE